jgi:hypothetical protein
LEFRSLQAVSSLSKLVQGGLVVDRNLIQEVAKIALSSQTIVLEVEVGIHVGFASIASKGALLTIVNERELTLALSVEFVLRGLCQRVNKEAKGDLRLLDKRDFLRRLNHCASHEFGATVSFINLYPRDSC